jgi:peptide/nickel transport system ATP-binding protein/oligopeptide transport system ATP-binding protein
MNDEPLMVARDLVKAFAARGGRQEVRAVDGVSFDVRRGEVLGLVGESGCGKSTTGRLLLRLVEPTAGTVIFDGQDVLGLPGDEVRRLRARMQIVFQDPYGSLHPRRRIADILAEAAIVQGRPRAQAHARAAEVLELVHLRPEDGRRYAHEFSGGQRQRIGIARALMLEPQFVVLDEPLSALDVSIQASVLELLGELRERLGLAYLFISHDLSVVRHICDRVAVMYLGRIVETGPTTEVFANPRHPYTRALLSAAPIPDPRVQRARQRIVLHGDVPSPTDPPSGCAFRTRCWKAQDRCAAEVPSLTSGTQRSAAACHFPLEEAPDAAATTPAGAPA